jgi:hypothetical protein
MLHAGLDLSRNRIDVCLMSEHGEVVAEFASPSETRREVTHTARTPNVLAGPASALDERQHSGLFRSRRPLRLRGCRTNP